MSIFNNEKNLNRNVIEWCTEKIQSWFRSRWNSIGSNWYPTKTLRRRKETIVLIYRGWGFNAGFIRISNNIQLSDQMNPLEFPFQFTVYESEGESVQRCWGASSLQQDKTLIVLLIVLFVSTSIEKREFEIDLGKFKVCLILNFEFWLQHMHQMVYLIENV